MTLQKILKERKALSNCFGRQETGTEHMSHLGEEQEMSVVFL